MDYTDEQRACYSWATPDGTPRYSDPLLTRRHLSALLEGDLDRVNRELNGEGGLALQHQASVQAAWATCEAFGLVPLDPDTGQGVNAACALHLYRDFLCWCEALKKNGATTSASPSPESPESCPPPSPTDSTAP